MYQLPHEKKFDVVIYGCGNGMVMASMRSRISSESKKRNCQKTTKLGQNEQKKHLCCLVRRKSQTQKKANPKNAKFREDPLESDLIEWREEERGKSGHSLSNRGCSICSNIDDKRQKKKFSSRPSRTTSRKITEKKSVSDLKN